MIVNGVIGKIVEPRFGGRDVGISSVTVLLSLQFWGWVFAPQGLFLSGPLSLVLAVAPDASPHTGPIAIMLGSDVARSETSDKKLGIQARRFSDLPFQEAGVRAAGGSDGCVWRRHGARVGNAGWPNPDGPWRRTDGPEDFAPQLVSDGQETMSCSEAEPVASMRAQRRHGE